MRRDSLPSKALAAFFSVTLVAGLWPAPATRANAEALSPESAEAASAAADTGDGGAAAPDGDAAAAAPADPAPAEGTGADAPQQAEPAPADGEGSSDPSPSDASAATGADDAAEKSDASQAEAASQQGAPSDSATDGAQAQPAAAAAAQAASAQAPDAAKAADTANPADASKPAPDVPMPAFEGRQRTAAGTNVLVSAPEGAFPEGVELRVADADATRPMDAAAQMVGGEAYAGSAVDIAFVKDGARLEPSAGTQVRVRLQLAESLDEEPEEDELAGIDFFGDAVAAQSEGEQYVVVHLSDGGAAERVSAAEASALGAEFSASEFSTYGIVAVGPADDGGIQLATQSTADINVDGTVHSVSRTGTPSWSAPTAGTQFAVSTSDDYGLWRFSLSGGRGGGSSAAGGGYGGVTTVVEPYGTAQILYVVTGGQGVTGRAGGSNGATMGAANGGGGGGNGRYRRGVGSCSAGGSGGGASHIALSAGALKNVAAGDIMLVAGGGGGAGWNRGGGSGGGVNGGGGGVYSGSVPGGTQTSGYQMGQGQDGVGGTYNVQRGSEGKGGGGGGYWGGTARTYGGRNSNAAGAGGSGFLNGAFVNGERSSDGSTVIRDGITVARTSNGGNAGAGAASVEYLASIVKLDKQAATTQGTENVYAAPQAADYYLSYSVGGLANKSDKIEVPTRDGYVFEGYYTEKGFDIWAGTHEGTQYVASDGTISAELYKQGSLTLYAHMVPVWATVTLDAGDTSSAGTTKIFERYEQGIYNEKSSSPTEVYTIEIPKRDCDVTYDAASGTTTRTSEKVSQTFLGYNDGDTQLIDGNGVILEAFSNTRFKADATLAAQWQTASTKLPAATRDGYTFDGWFDKADGTRVGGADETYTPTKPKAELEARWTPIVYTVTLDGQGATGPIDRTTQVYEKYDTGVFADAACTVLADTIVPPERTYTVTYNMENGGSLPEGTSPSETVSYQFDGYYTPQGGSTQLFSNTGAKTEAFTNTFFGENRTLNAHWTAKSCELPTPTVPEGKTFTGWSTDKGAHSGRTGTFTPTGNVTLYATYAKTVYRIQYTGLEGVIGFNPPDAIGIAESEETWDTSFTVANPTRPGYAFTGWNIAGMDETTTHHVGDEGTTTNGTTYNGVTGTYFMNLRGTTGTVTFAAQWKPIATDVKLDGQGATSQGSPAVFEAYSQSIYKTKTETAGDPAYSHPMDPNGEPSGNAAIDLPQRVYDVTYDLGGKTGTLTDLTQPATYDFGGYYTDTNGKGQQLLGPDGKVTSSFTNTYFSPEATAPKLYAKWSGGSVQVRDNASTSEGYRFIGWSADPTATTATYLPGDTLTPTGPMTLHAVYDQPTYVVSYSAHGGSGAPDPQSKAHNATLVLSDKIPTREKSQSAGATVTFDANQGSSTGATGDAITGTVDSTWAFTSWNTLPAGGTGGTSYNPRADYTANAAVTLHAQWGETRKPLPITLPTPTFEGHIFQGWGTDPAGGTIVGQAGDQYTPNESRTLYAQWTPARYRIAYHDGERLVKTSETYEYGQVITLETADGLDIHRDGWTLEGWSLTQGSLAVDYVAGTRAQNLATTDDVVEAHAIWSRDLTFVSGEGDPIDVEGDGTSTQSDGLRTQSFAEVDVRQFTDGITIGTVDTPELEPIEGFTALGWNADPDDVSGKVDLPADAEVAWTDERATLFGVYVRDASVSYEGAGATDGMTEMSVGQQLYNASGTIGKASVTLAENGFERRGYSFASWSLGKPGETYEWEVALKEQAAKTAAAVWLDLKQYLVTFDANGGEGDMAPQVMDLGVKAALSKNAFAREGFDFVGWNTAADGSGKAFADGEEVLDLAKTGEEIVLYAQWKEKAKAAEAKGAPRGGASPRTGDPTSLALVAVLAVVAGAAIVLGVRSRRQRKG